MKKFAYWIKKKKKQKCIHNALVNKQTKKDICMDVVYYLFPFRA